jgi:hypothetical protein
MRTKKRLKSNQKKEFKKETNPNKYTDKKNNKLLKMGKKLKDEEESEKTTKDDSDDFCEKCQHKKGRRRKRNEDENDLKVKNVDDNKPCHTDSIF